MFLCAAFGLGGFALLAIALFGIPSIQSAFTFKIDWLNNAAPKEDHLPWFLLASWIVVWLVAFFSGPLFRRRAGTQEATEEDTEEEARLPSHAWLVLAPILAICVGLGSWWATQQLKADYHMFRALAYSKAASRSLIPKLQQYQSQLSPCFWLPA